MPTETSLSSLSQIIDGDDFFRELDEEMIAVDSTHLGSHHTDALSPTQRSPSLLRRLYNGFRRGSSASGDFNRRHSVTSFSYSDIFPIAAQSSTQSSTEDVSGGNITCRLCDEVIPLDIIEEHTRWCKQFQNCSLKKITYDAFARKITEDLHVYPFNDRTVQQMQSLVAKVMTIDEVDGATAASSLAKVAWKLTKVPRPTQEIPRKHLKRLKYLVRIESVLCMMIFVGGSEKGTG